MSLGAGATEEDGEIIAKLFGAVGKVWKADEKLFDAVTGLRCICLFHITYQQKHNLDYLKLTFFHC